MSNFSGPASKSADAALFSRSPRSARTLQAQSRRELRNVARAGYMRLKTAAENAAAQNQSSGGIQSGALLPDTTNAQARLDAAV